MTVHPMPDADARYEALTAILSRALHESPVRDGAECPECGDWYDRYTLHPHVRRHMEVAK